MKRLSIITGLLVLLSTSAVGLSQWTWQNNRDYNEAQTTGQVKLCKIYARSDPLMIIEGRFEDCMYQEGYYEAEGE